MIEKVAVFILRANGDLLLLKHPYGGVQLPAGTVEPGESHAAAAQREAHEETGLLPETFAEIYYIGVRPDPPRYDHVFLAARSTLYAHPDPASFDWATLPRAAMVRREGREAHGYTHITYTETNYAADPSFATYQLTGWVTSAHLVDKQVRHFYRITTRAETPTRWTVRADHHTFTLFWAACDRLPDIVYPQNTWLEVLKLDDDH